MNKQPRMGSTAEARQAESFDSIPHGLDYSRYGDNQPVDDDEIYLAAVEGFLPREAGKAQETVAQIFRLCHATNEDVRHDGRFDKIDAHVISSPRESMSLPLGGAEHVAKLQTSNRSHDGVRQSQNVTNHGKSIASAGEGFAQIAGERPCDGIGQDQPSNDPVFIGMRNPGYEPDFTIHALDIDASGENIGDDNRLGQGWVVIWHGGLQ